MNEPFETIMEVKEDFMVSPAGDSEPTFRTAHFLKPIANFTDGQVCEILSSSVTVLPMFEHKERPLAIHFNGWPQSPKKWIGWVDTLHPRYESVWKKAGIFEAIMSTKCCIVKNQDLAIGVAEKWCSKTNTFVFPWGEATITLEDVMVLGGYPVLGEPVFTALESQEMREIEERLVLARMEPWRRKKTKASTAEWMNLFINSEFDIEHEAFLATWLSMFVFPDNGLVKKSVFPIAVHLARGNPIALAPAVLAGIYKDLDLLKTTMVGLTKNPALGDKLHLEVTLQSPMYFVQVWVWERFKNLQPEPELINNGDPMLGRWHKVKALKTDNVRLALDSAKEDFLWRPYVRYADKYRLFYPENEIWVSSETNLDKELVSYVTCLRASELVGIDTIIKQYLPHRVAMQFGMDQDVPGCVPRFNETKAVAWENYCRPISDGNLYFPCRLFEADVTTRYAWWWKQSVLGHQDPVKNIVRRKRSARSSKRRPHSSKANRSGNDADVPPGFPPKLVSTVIFGKSYGDSSETRKGDSDAGFLPKYLKTVPPGNSFHDGLKGKVNIGGVVPTSFSPKHNTLTPCISVEDCKPVLEENKCGSITLGLGKHLSNQCSSATAADYEDVKNILPLTKPVARDNITPSVGDLKENLEDAIGSKESMMSIDRVNPFGTQGERCGCVCEIKVMELEQRIRRLEGVITKLKIARFGHS
ncbi:uncharacterized protein LOC133299852 [Gastrolobium bilobum]|uniref:uncharacterized protein LOC133299852 n=1 Tax=Gastrolobium bilobum TaxID=150636 RepID=UPI002AB19580|nr:uncharacterized protein LOC133299852 [Gastrolobium bilobum]